MLMSEGSDTEWVTVTASRHDDEFADASIRRAHNYDASTQLPVSSRSL